MPLVEDPGSFAVRGFLIDVFTPHHGHPTRIELDDERVVSIKRFNPDDQRTRETVANLAVHPVREALTGPDELERTRERIGRLCDEVNIPSNRKSRLIQDIESGRLFFGVERFLPAFYGELDDLFDYLPEGVRTVAIDPTGIVNAFAKTWGPISLCRLTGESSVKLRLLGLVNPVYNPGSDHALEAAGQPALARLSSSKGGGTMMKICFLVFHDSAPIMILPFIFLTFGVNPIQDRKASF